MLKIIFTLLALLTAALVGLFAYIQLQQPAPMSSAAGPQSTTTFTAPFSLINQDNQPVTQTSFLGKPTLYFFGFTHCPDICPTTLGAISNWLNQLGPDATKLNVVFISVDPERDTPATLKQYVASFHPQITAATGTQEQLRSMAKQFMVYYAKVPVKPGEDPANYMVSHSSMIIMADAKGTFMGTLDAHDADSKALAKLRSLLQTGN